MKRSTAVLSLFAGIGLCACNQTGPGAPAGAAATGTVSREDAAVLVNGRPISKLSVENLEQEFSQRHGGEGVSKEKIIEELTKREVLRQEAEKDKLPQDPSVAAKVDNAIRMVLSQVAAEHLAQQYVPTEEEIKKEYDQRVAGMKTAEYKARHILLDSEKSALDVIKRLEKGEDFAALAKKLSNDPGSKGSGGELGWFSPQQMVPPFSSALIGLKNGAITKAPVKTDFGWHVIQREDSREQSPPAFEAVKEQLVSFMQSQKLHQQIDALQAKAKIERMLPPEQKSAAEPAKPDAEAPAEAAEPPEATPAKP